MTAIRPSTQIALDGGAAGQALVVDPTGAFWEPGTPSGTPSGAAGGDLAGTYPNPTLALGTAHTWTAEQAAPDFKVTGLTGATNPTRYVGGTTTGHPTSGTFVAGDFVVTADGHIWVCSTGGSPGTWVDIAGSGGTTLTTGGNQGDLLVGSTSGPVSAMAAPPRGVAPTKYGQVLTCGAAGAFDAALVESPCIFWDPAQQQYGMVYTGYTQTTGNNGGTSAAVAGSIGLAYSRDLINWTKSGQILAASGSGVDASGCTGPVMVVEGGTYYLFYIGLTATGYERGTPTLCLATATSANGTYTRQGQVIGTSSAGTGWRSSKVYHASIVKKGSTYYAFVNALGTVSTVSRERIGYATATALAGPWTCDDTNSPILDAGVSGWDAGWVGDPSVYRIGDEWYMAYYGVNSGSTSAADGLAYTSDANFPLSWTKYAANPLVSPGAAGSFDSTYAHKPFVYVTGRDCFHYYTADDGTHRSVGLAVESPSSPTTITPTQTYVMRDRIVATGGETILTLGQTPVTNSPLVWKNGTLLWPSVDYTISGDTITLNSAVAASDVITDYYLTTSSATAAASLSGAGTAAFGPQSYSLGTYGDVIYG